MKMFWMGLKSKLQPSNQIINAWYLARLWLIIKDALKTTIVSSCLISNPNPLRVFFFRPSRWGWAEPPELYKAPITAWNIDSNQKSATSWKTKIQPASFDTRRVNTTLSFSSHSAIPASFLSISQPTSQIQAEEAEVSSQTHNTPFHSDTHRNWHTHTPLHATCKNTQLHSHFHWGCIAT